ncbi:amidohydrolase/deacetylase family metallohydrolase, partial [Mesorhizobium sp. M2A.F.Ca.ET.037.01.1.1]
FPNAPVFASGTVRPDMRLARERGVIFDIGHGMGSFDFEVAKAMLAEGLAPDVISSDVHLYCVDGPAFDMLVCMSKLMALGMPLVEVLRGIHRRGAQHLDQRLVSNGIAIGGKWWPNEAPDHDETERFEAHAHHTHVDVAARHLGPSKSSF